jgi:hypothetical protein
MEIIVPAAGLSTRFPGQKPKYMLTDADEKSMLYRAVKPYIGKYNITIGILREHNDIFQTQDFINKELGSTVNLIILPERTKGPADTVKQILNLANINPDSPILIKDCDSFFDFDHDTLIGNYVCVSHVEDSDVLYKLPSKSFVIENENSLIQKIVEKQVISGTYCVGGYRFEKSELFQNAYKKISELPSQSEIFVSHVIKSLMTDGHYFSTARVKNYTDVGTLEDWVRYNHNPVTRYDIDINGNIYRELSLLGLEIEKSLIEKPYIWTSKPLTKILIAWGSIDDKLYKRICDLTKDFRADELLLDVYNISWIAGHPRALAKWAASIFKLENIHPSRSLHVPAQYIDKLIWWADRLELKVHFI